MNNNLLKCFIKDKMVLLKYLHDICKDDNIAYVTQKEISEELGFSASKVYRLLTELIAENLLLETNNKHGKYQLSSEGLKKIDELLLVIKQ